MGLDSTQAPHGSFAKLGLADGKSLYAKLVVRCNLEFPFTCKGRLDLGFLSYMHKKHWIPFYLQTYRLPLMYDFLVQVGSDGSKSHVRELTGIKTTDWKYPQDAIICTVEHTEENYCAWQRFLPNGPIALLPVGDKFSNIVWSMSPKEAENCKSMSGEVFVRAVNHALDDAYGPHPKSWSLGGGNWLSAFVPSSANECFELPPKVVKMASERMVFPLSLRHANSYVSKRVVFIGDAAHTVHPLAGQGVNMGFADVSSLTRVLVEGVAVGSDIGEVLVILYFYLVYTAS